MVEMMRFILASLPALAACLAALPVHSAGKPEPVDEKEKEPIYVLADAPGGYGEAQSDLVLTLGPADGAPRSLTLLALARLSLENGLALDGLSYAEAAAAEDPTPETQARSAQMMAALSVIDLRPRPLPEGTVETLAAPGDLPYRQAILAAAHARTGDHEAAVETLTPALEDLAELPRGLATRLVPLLLDAAVERHAWDTARALAVRALDEPWLRDGSALEYQLGRIALYYEDGVRAFDHLAKAAAQDDIWSHRARMALIGLVQESGAATPEEIQEMLIRAYSSWRGDEETIQTLKRLEEVSVRAGDPIGALMALSRIMTNYPGSPAAAAARIRAHQTIKSYYDAGLMGEIPLDKFLSGHAKIARDYRFVEGYDLATERFADHLLSLGATGRAGDEYRLAYEYLEAAEQLGLFSTPLARIEALRLKEADARLTGGRTARAAAILGRAFEAEGPGVADRLGKLRARYFELTGETLEGGTAPEAPSATYIRLIAEEHYAAEDWAAAKGAYLKLAEALGEELPPEDAVALVLSAHRSGDTTLSGVLADVFSDRIGISAETLDDDVVLERPIEVEMRAAIARAVVDRAERALDSAGRIRDGSKTNQESIHE